MEKFLTGKDVLSTVGGLFGGVIAMAFAEVLTDPDRILPWKQPDSTNPYAKGDKVTHKGFTWISDIDGNVWEPGAYGWSKSE